MTESEAIERVLFLLREGKIPEHQVGCKLCNKGIYQIFVEHIAEELERRWT